MKNDFFFISGDIYWVTTAFDSYCFYTGCDSVIINFQKVFAR